MITYANIKKSGSDFFHVDIGGVFVSFQHEPLAYVHQDQENK